MSDKHGLACSTGSQTSSQLDPLAAARYTRILLTARCTSYHIHFAPDVCSRWKIGSEREAHPTGNGVI